jgi:hypothetical protein
MQPLLGDRWTRTTQRMSKRDMMGSVSSTFWANESAGLVEDMKSKSGGTEAPKHSGKQEESEGTGNGHQWD